MVFIKAFNFPNKLFFKNSYFPWTSKILQCRTDPKEVQMSVLGWIQTCPLSWVLFRRFLWLFFQNVWLSTIGWIHFLTIISLGFRREVKRRGKLWVLGSSAVGWLQLVGRWFMLLVQSVQLNRFWCPDGKAEVQRNSKGGTSSWLIYYFTERSHRLPFSEWISESNFEHPSRVLS